MRNTTHMSVGISCKGKHGNTFWGENLDRNGFLYIPSWSLASDTGAVFMAILCCLKTRWHKKSGLTKHILKTLLRKLVSNKIWCKWMMYLRSWCVCKQKLGPLLDYLSFLPRHKKLGKLPHQQHWSSMTLTPRVIVVVCSVKKHRRQQKNKLCC